MVPPKDFSGRDGSGCSPIAASWGLGAPHHSLPTIEPQFSLDASKSDTRGKNLMVHRHTEFWKVSHSWYNQSRAIFPIDPFILPETNKA